MASVSTVESLILKATNPLIDDEDPNLIQRVCQAIANEEGGIKTALRLIIHKMHSPQEKEALQTLLILQSCVNNCGVAFHAEIGKFRFLNEMIKIVSPKYMGNHSSPNVKKKVLELIYTWTVDLKNEQKILEAYQMLKDQNIVKEDPQYIGMPSKETNRPKSLPPIEDEEKSRLLQRLLQSKRPEDVLKANAIIKHMVKEDEKRMERSTQRSIQVETAFNNVSVLDEMLTQFEHSHSASQSDLDVMSELNTSCMNLQTNIYQMVSEIDDKEEGIGDILKANDELSRVMGRYKVLIVERKFHESDREGLQKNLQQMDEDSLLDLSSPQKVAPAPKETSSIDDFGLSSLNLHPNSVSSPSDDLSLLNKMQDNNPLSSILPSANSSLSKTPKSDSSLNCSNALLLPEKPLLLDNTSESKDKPKPLEELDILGSNLLKQSLPPNTNPVGLQFRLQEKVSLNQMKSQINTTASSDILTSINSKENYLTNINDGILIDNNSKSLESNYNAFSIGQSLLNSDLSILANPTNSISTSQDEPKKTDLANGVSHEPISNMDAALLDISSDTITVLGSEFKPLNEPLIDPSVVTSEIPKEPVATNKSSSYIQLSEVKALNDINISLESIKPGKQSSIKVIESNMVSLTLHFAENKPREDVSSIVVSVTSQNPRPLSNYVLQAVVPKGCKVRLQTPSNSSLQGFSPFLPPPAITQIMHIANPNKLNVSLKMMLSYTLDEEEFVTDKSEIESLPL